ncbi:MAG: hypothetical protein ACM3WR_07980 [Solirubrobacterales bacterium]
MRPFTKVVLVVLFALIVIAAVAQFTIGGPDRPYPGPVSGTPLPSTSAAP